MPGDVRSLTAGVPVSCYARGALWSFELDYKIAIWRIAHVE
jgi:hypothetical protein